MSRNDRTLVGSLVAAASLLFGSSAIAAGDAADDFFKAYYLENEQGDLAAALELYRSVAANGSAPEELRAQAAASGRGCAEELAASDFASLCPEDTIFYAELNRPAEQLGRLLGQLGLMQGSEGSGAIAISPKLVEGLLGCRGAAVAVTQIDPTGGPPSGVAILHPGDLDVIRGLIETALPAGGQPSKSVAGYPTWNIENQVFVTTTERLIVASPERSEIEGVIARMHGDRQGSLAANEDLADTMAMRGDDLLFFCLNLEPIMPTIQTLIAAQAGNDPQIAMALALVDVESFRAVAGRAGVDENGLSMDVGLQLDEGHNNVVFNLMRMPHLAKRSFGLVPEGAAFFAACALNEKADVAGGLTNQNGEPVVTVMDFGREVFGNIVDVAIYGLPSTTAAQWGPMPDVALALSVNDPARTRALWSLVLGIAKGATGSGQMEPQQVRVADTTVERFEIEGVGVYVYTGDDRMIVSASERAIEAALTSAAKGRSILDDELFAGTLQSFAGDNTTAVAVSMGRVASMAKAFVGEREMQQIAPYLPMIERAVIAGTVQHSETRLALSARIGGLPKIGGMLSDILQQQIRGTVSRNEREVAQVWQRDAAAIAAPVPVAAVAAAATPVVFSEVEAAAPVEAYAEKAKPADAAEKALRDTFEKLVQAGEVEGANGVGGALYGHLSGDAFDLNNFAWALLTEERYAHEYDELALRMALQSNEISEYANWYYLDTLAHAYFHTGDLQKAVEVQTKAVEVAGKDPRAKEALQALKRFQDAAKAKSRGSI